jgi:TRAP-type C4-dicarboxylate transport system substrate-binding protein
VVRERTGCANSITLFNHPDDLKGLRIRIQPSETMLRLMQVFGAEAVELPWGNVFTALKSRLVDGAENSVAALIVGNHADVVSHYSFDEHTMVPDVLLIGAARLQSLTPVQREIVREAALASYHHMNTLWSDFEVRSRAAIEQRGVTFVSPREGPVCGKGCGSDRRFCRRHLVAGPAPAHRPILSGRPLA